MQLINLEEVGPLLAQAKAIALEYYRITGKPLGITGEVGEYEAAKRLNLTLVEARTPGYDAIWKGERIQIKTRAIADFRRLGGQKIGSLKAKDAGLWDALVLVLLDMSFEPRRIYKCPRLSIDILLGKTESNARKRGQLAVSEVVKSSELVWQDRDEFRRILNRIGGEPPRPGDEIDI